MDIAEFNKVPLEDFQRSEDRCVSTQTAAQAKDMSLSITEAHARMVAKTSGHIVGVWRPGYNHYILWQQMAGLRNRDWTRTLLSKIGAKFDKALVSLLVGIIDDVLTNHLGSWLRNIS